MSAVGGPLRIFLSYRRDDSQGFAGRIYDRLADRFGPEAVFRDINDIEPGRPWAEAIDEALGSCDVFVLLIGREWLNATDDEGHRRLDDPEDRHRREIEVAVNREIRMFVALMENAPMPAKDQLPRQPAGQQAKGGRTPKGLQEVPNLQAVVIADFAFDFGIERLIASIEMAAEQEGAEIARRGRAVVVPEGEREEVATPRREDAQRRRRLGILAAVALGAAAVLVGAVLLFAGGDDDGSGDDGGSAQVVGSRPVGQHPVGLASGARGIWVTDQDGSVWLIEPDPDEITLGGSVDVGGAPEGIAVDDDNSGWVANGSSGSVLKLVPGVQGGDSDECVSDRLPFQCAEVPGPFAKSYGVAVGLGSVWVTNSGSDSVTQIDPGSPGEIPEPIQVGRKPESIVVEDGSVWVANRGDSFSRLDPGDDYENHETPVEGTRPGSLSTTTVLSGSPGAIRSVVKIDPDTPDDQEEIDLGSVQQGIIAASDWIWVSLRDNQLARLDPASGDASSGSGSERAQKGSPPARTTSGSRTAMPSRGSAPQSSNGRSRVSHGAAERVWR